MYYTGGNRRGRRAGYRGPKKEPQTKQFEDDYDFESANANFKKEEIEEELQKKLGLVTLNDEVCLCNVHQIPHFLHPPFYLIFMIVDDLKVNLQFDSTCSLS